MKQAQRAVGSRAAQIAAVFRWPIEDIEAAIDYIERHEAEVMADYQQILARHRQATYSPEVAAKLSRNRETCRARVEARCTRQSEGNCGQHGR